MNGLLDDQVLKCGRKDGRPYGFRFPAEQVFHRWSADSALTWSHTAAEMEFGFAPGFGLLEAAEGNVFAAADDGFRRDGVAQFGAQREGSVQRA